MLGVSFGIPDLIPKDKIGRTQAFWRLSAGSPGIRIGTSLPRIGHGRNPLEGLGLTAALPTVGIFCTA
jgi:hypothetical protein